jgi:outer membrane protein assembly factor BamB
MSAFHVVIRPRPELAPSSDLSATYGLLDLLVDGNNLTARIGQSQALAVLGDLGHAVAHLLTGRRTRTTVELYAEDETWELGFELDGPEVLVTVFRSGPVPEVAIHERAVPLGALRQGVLDALEEAPNSKTPGAVRAGVLGAHRALEAAPSVGLGSRVVRQKTSIAPEPVEGYGFSASAALRQTGAGPDHGSDRVLERADLHSLLVRGELKFEAQGHSAELGPLHVFLAAEKLVLLAEEVFSAWKNGRPIFRRIECDQARFAVRRGPGDGPMALTVSSPFLRAERPGKTFPEIPVPTFVQAVAAFAEALSEAFLAKDPTQAKNLRLGGLRETALRLRGEAEDALAQDSVTNPDPENYRSFALLSPRRSQTRGPWAHGGKMRFVPRWVATVPGIDLGATFLCGDRILLGASRETACVHRTTGEVLWRVPTARAACVITPLGLARLHPDGRVVLHELETGEARFVSTVEPRRGSRPAGAVVCAPGLPKLLVVAEGDRRITAIDLMSGEVRWRFTGPRPTGYRLRRAGRLLLVAATDCALMALDVTSGEVVWRLRDRVPFAGELALDQEAAFAIAGAQSSQGKLVELDLWSGQLRWSVELSEGWLPGQAPLLAGNAVVVPSRDREGCGAHAFDRTSGELLWAQGPGLVSPMAAWLAVDQSLVINSASGSLLCLDARTGKVRYSHVFSRHVEADQPRRLEPVLRSGALFVPQHQVHVVRPRDGELLGSVPTDLIPDLVRVDERCDVYVVEESGHVAAFGAAPRLTLVR